MAQWTDHGRSEDEKARFFQAFVLWCQGRHPHRDLSDLTWDTPLLGHGILNSLQVMDLLLFLEHYRKRPLQAEEIGPQAFISATTLYGTFIEPVEVMVR